MPYAFWPNLDFYLLLGLLLGLEIRASVGAGQTNSAALLNDDSTQSDRKSR